MNHRSKFFRWSFLGLILLLGATFAQAAENYDRYTTLLREKAQSPTWWGKLATDFLTYPFELIRWPTDKGLVLFDEYHLWDKGQWIYERMTDYGVTPRFDGADFDLIRMASLRSHFPDATLKSWISFWPHRYFVAGGKTGLERIANTPVRSFATLNYESRPEEFFYGIGPHTSQGDGTSFKYEATTVQGEVGYSKDPSMGTDIFAAYKRVNITDGEDGGRGIIDNIFRNQTIPGLDGDEIFSTGVKFVRDKRNYKESSTKGYLLRLGFSYNEGLYHSNARYFRYQTEFIRYFRLGSDRRVFVTRFYGEHNNEAHGHSVPFHQMVRLGDYGLSSGLSNTLRGYDENRFTAESGALMNLEYRYTIYEYRDWKVDTVVFYDAGQVFNDFSRFQFKDFRQGYGGGFRVGILNNVILTLEVGHGDEGTHFYVKSRSPF